MERLSRLFSAIAATAALCVTTTATATPQITSGDVERALPPGSVTVREVQGGGAQIYACHELANQYVWILVGPQAVLVNDDGSIFGVHTAGPKWVAQDGSSIVANSDKPLARISHPDALPALLLSVIASGGPGALSGILYVSRTNVLGGMPPDAGCDAEHAGATVARHYSAVYRFFK